MVYNLIVDKLGWHHLQVILMFFYQCVIFIQNVNLSVGIVAITDNFHNPSFEAVQWDQFTIGLVLASLFWGYAIAPIPAGLLAHKIGPKIPMICAIVIASVLTTLLPLIVYKGWQYVCIARFFIGLMHGFGLPCIYTILSKWVHPQERSLSVSMVFIGGYLGTIIMLAISGSIAVSSIGWPGIFYISGAIGLIYSVILYIYGSNSPLDCIHKVSKDELEIYEFIIEMDSKQKPATPWREILSSMPFWSLLCAHMAGSWGFFLMIIELPSIINGLIGIDIQSNALLSSLPYLLMLVLGFVLGYLSDILIRKKFFKVGTSRKMFTSIGMGLPIPFLVSLTFVDNIYLIILFLTIIISAEAANNCGFLANHLDLSPNFAGTIMGCTTCASNVMAVIAPIIVGLIVTDKTDSDLWQIVFWITAGIYICGNGLFVIFGSGDAQKWNTITKI